MPCRGAKVSIMIAVSMIHLKEACDTAQATREVFQAPAASHRNPSLHTVQHPLRLLRMCISESPFDCV